MDVNHSDWDCGLEPPLPQGIAPPRPAPGRGAAARRCHPAGRGAGRRALRQRRGCAAALGDRSGGDPAAGRGRRLPLDPPRPPAGAVGFAGVESRPRFARCSAPPTPPTRAGARGRAPARNAAERACRQRLSDRSAEPEGAPDELPPRPLCQARLRHRRRASSHALRAAGEPGRAGADPPAAGIGQRRVLHHAGGRDRDRQPGRLARPLRGAARHRHGRPADGRPRPCPEGRGGGPCRRQPAGGRYGDAAGV